MTYKYNCKRQTSRFAKVSFAVPCPSLKADPTVKFEVTFCVRGVISPVLSNLYLNEVDRMLERAMKTTRFKQYTAVQYARFADDRVPRVRKAERLSSAQLLNR